MSKVKVIDRDAGLSWSNGHPRARTVEVYEAVNSHDLENVVREISDHNGLRIAQKRVVALIVNED